MLLPLKVYHSKSQTKKFNSLNIALWGNEFPNIYSRIEILSLELYTNYFLVLITPGQFCSMGDHSAI